MLALSDTALAYIATKGGRPDYLARHHIPARYERVVPPRRATSPRSPTSARWAFEPYPRRPRGAGPGAGQSGCRRMIAPPSMPAGPPAASDTVIVMAGVPSIVQAMLDEVPPSSRPAFACSRKPCARARARVTSGCNSARSPRPILRSRSGAIRSSIRSTGPTRMWYCTPAIHRSSRLRSTRSRTCSSQCGEHNQIALAPSHGENRGSSPLGSANDFKGLAD
jgi:hypothetical protein